MLFLSESDEYYIHISIEIKMLSYLLISNGVSM